MKRKHDNYHVSVISLLPDTI